MSVQIRRARPDEAGDLTSIAFAAKRHWDYPEKWIQLWTTELTITPEFIAGHEVFVAMLEGRIAGCCALVMSDTLSELEHMWIDPAKMGQGVGRALFDHLIERARELGLSELELSADPNAEGFYERMGARRVGEVRYQLDGRPRVLPRMRISLKPSP